MWLMRLMLSTALALLFSANVDARLLLIVSQESPVYQEFQQGMLGRLNSVAAEALDLRTADDVDGLDFSPYSAIVVAGVDAAKVVAARNFLDKPVLYTMLPLSSYQWLDAHGMLSPQHKLLYIDQPVGRYLQLVRAAMPDITTIAYLYGETSAFYIDELKKTVDATKLQMIFGDMMGSDKLSSLLKSISADSDVMLLLPDPFFYNRRVVQEVLLASFRNKHPLVVYSESFLKAGAMLALFSTPGQIGRQTAEIVNCLGRPCYGTVMQRSAPKYFSVMVNDVVARQMGMSSKSAEELQQELESIGTSRPR